MAVYLTGFSPRSKISISFAGLGTGSGVAIARHNKPLQPTAFGGG